MQSTGSVGGSRRFALGAALVIAGAVARACAALGEPWLDEIWTLDMARGVSFPLDVLRDLANHNNHPLHTLLVAPVGMTDRWWAYRLPSLVAGVASIGLFGLVLRHRGRATVVAGLALSAASVWLIHYASEARGYALCLAFSLAAIAIHDPLEGRRRDSWAPVFWAIVLLGTASHVMFVFAWAALLAGRLGEALAWRQPVQALAHEAFRWHLPPALALGGIWFLYLRDYQVFGGPEVPLATTLAAAASLTVGFPMLGPLRTVGAGLFAGLAGVGVAWAFSTGRARGFFYGSGILGIPALTVALGRGEFLAPRYFLVSAVLFLLLMAELTGALVARGRAGRIAALTLVLGLATANAIQCLPVWKYGRGQYLAVFSRMATGTTDPVRVGSDHLVRTRAVRDFLAIFSEPARRIHLLAPAHWPDEGVDWYILERSSGEKLKGDVHAPPQRLVVQGQAYALVQAYPSSPISGIDWQLYRRATSVDP